MLKRVVNLCISSFVGVADALRNVFGRPKSTCVVLAYHSVTENERSRFAAQMDLLLRKTKPVSADVESLPGDGQAFAAITFDDGFQNVVDNALPELRKRQIPATLFVVTEALGTARAWEHRGGHDTRDEQVMSVEQMCKLPADLVEIGSHTMNHVYLPSASEDQVEQELLGSRLKLEKLLGRKVKLFSFPYGGFNDNTIQACRKAGYTRVFSALPVFSFAEQAEFVSGRVGTAPTDWPIEFRLKLSGAYRWLPRAFALKRQIRTALSGKRTPVSMNASRRVA